MTPSHAELAVGARLPVHTQTVRRQDLVRYAAASGDLNTIHWDERAAAEAGLPDVVAHGMLTMGIAARALTRWTGDPGSVVSYSARFARPVVVPRGADGVRVEVSGTVTELLGAPHVRVELVVRCGPDKVLTRTRAVVALRPADPS